MTRRPRAAAPTASVTWRDGVHLTGTPIWCDARRRRDVCFVSSADRVGKAGHGQLIGSPLTLALLGASGGGHLAVPLHRRFTLGTVRLELIDSGRGPGAAALYVDIAGKTVLYAGAIRANAEVRACDAVVVSAAYASAIPPLADEIDRTIEWTKRELASGRRPILLVETPLDGLEVAMHLASAGIALAGGRPIREAAQRAGDHVVDAMTVATTRAARDAELRGEKRAEPTSGVRKGSDPISRDPRADDARAVLGGEKGSDPISRAVLGGEKGSEPISRDPRADDARGLAISSPGKEPRAILWLARDRAGAMRAAGDAHAVATLAVDGDFAWVGGAGKADVLAWIEATNAREVYVTGACAEDIAEALGKRARVIGPPHQMTLFEATP